MKRKIEWYREVLELEPYSKVFFPLARLLIDAEKYEDALAVLQQGLQRHPEFVEAKLLQAEVLQRLGREQELDSLVQALSESMAEYPAFWEAWARQLDDGEEGRDPAMAMRFLAAWFAGHKLSWATIIQTGLQTLMGQEPDLPPVPGALREAAAMVAKDRDTPEIAAKKTPPPPEEDATAIGFVPEPEDFDSPEDFEQEVDSESEALAANEPDATQKTGTQLSPEEQDVHEHAAGVEPETLIGFVPESESEPESSFDETFDEQAEEDSEAAFVDASADDDEDGVPEHEPQESSCKSKGEPEQALSFPQAVSREAARHPHQPLEPGGDAGPVSESSLRSLEESLAETDLDPDTTEGPAALADELEHVEPPEDEEESAASEAAFGETDGGEDEEEDEEGEEETFSLRTRTMADLLAEQGDYEGALDIYRELLVMAPEGKAREELEDLVNEMRRLAGEKPGGNGGKGRKTAAKPQKSTSKGLKGKTKLISALESLAQRLEAKAAR